MQRKGVFQMYDAWFYDSVSIYIVALFFFMCFAALVVDGIERRVVRNHVKRNNRKDYYSKHDSMH